ncbi:MAG: DUF58 domain-containing protein [Clostridia bacterium]|nr:DUF58 domain-containing protein [Clostridia bacterium]
MNALILLAVMLALYVLSVFLLKAFALRGLVCTRTFRRSTVFEGEEDEMIEVVRNDRPMIVPWLRVESRVSPHIRLGTQENLNVSDFTHYCSLFFLMPYQQIRRRHKVKFLHRGQYDLGNASLTAGDLFGLIEAHREQEMSAAVLVYPRLLDESELPTPLTMLMDEVVSRRQLLTDPFLVRGIRPYQMGDPVRDIHWPATARMNEPHVRLHDYAARSRLLVVLNFERKEGQWGDRLMEYEQEEIEREISIAATLCVRALDLGLSAGFAANMPIGEETTSAFIPPQRDPSTMERLLSALACLRLKRTLSFPTFLQTLDSCQGLDILVLSCFDSEDIQTELRRLRADGNQAELFLVKGGEA